MPKKIAPLVSQFCRRKHNENESEVVYPQIIFKSSDLLEQFDLSGYPTINISCSVSRNVKECREHGYHCVYLSNKHLEALSIFEGDWVCIVVGNREKKNIISCHVASAHLLPGEQKLSSNQIDDNNNNDNKGNNDDDDGNDGCCVSSQFGFSLANGNYIGTSCPPAVEIIALPIFSGPNFKHDKHIHPELLPNHIDITPAVVPKPTLTDGDNDNNTEDDDSRKLFSLKIADKCKVSRVRSPLSNSKVDYTPYLQKYFSKIRVLSLNEIIEVDITEAKSAKKLIYFQITELVPDVEVEDWDGLKYNDVNLKCATTCLVSGDDGRTTLIVEGATNSRIPCQINAKDALEPYKYNEELREKILNVFLPQLHYTSRRETPYASILITGGRGSGKRRLVNSVGERLGLHVFEVNCKREILEGASDVGGRKMAKKMIQTFTKAYENTPCILHVRRFRAVAAVQGQTKNEDTLLQFVTSIRATLEKLHASSLSPNGHPLLFVATCEESDDVEGAARAIFTHEFAIKPPEDEVRLDLLETYLKRVKLEDGFDIKGLVQRTAGRQCTEIKGIIAEAGKHAFKKVWERKIRSEKEMKTNGNNDKKSTLLKAKEEIVLSKDDFDLAFKSMDVGGSSPGATASIPNVKWKDVGGLGQAKDEVMDMITLPLKHPELFASGVRQRSGVLFYGPPGTGKTLLAKAVATECNCNFISVKGPELLNMYIGESERNVRQVFERARAAKPCVLFFDEIDSLAPARGKGSDSGGVMDRVVSQLLTEIDGMSGSGGDLFVIGATNRPDLLDSSLLRPGRFDRLLYLGIAPDNDAQLKILKALTRKFTLKDDVRLEDVISTCPTNYTGADFYALASNALSMSIRRRAKEIQGIIDGMNKDLPYYETPTSIPKYLQKLSEEDLDVKVGMEDFMEAREGIVASVSREENEKYLKLKEEYSPSEGKEKK